MVVLNDRIASARYVTKTNTTALDTFKAEEMGYIGTIADDVYFNNTSTRKHTTETDFDISTIEKLPQVDILYGHQNEGNYLFKAAVDAGSKGIVYAGSGNGSMSEVADEAAKEAEDAGIEIVRSSRTGNGVVTPKDYISANSLNPQKARILLMLSLTKTEDKEKIQQYFDEY
jgi:L-asparaginase